MNALQAAANRLKQANLHNEHPFTYAKAAGYLGTTEESLMRLVRIGELPHRVQDGTPIVTVGDLWGYLEMREAQSEAEVLGDFEAADFA